MLRRDFVDLSTRLAVARILGSAPPHPASVLHAARRLRERSPALAPPYLDAHAHSASGLLLAYRAMSGGPTQRELPTDGAALIARMDADGVRRAFVLSTAYQMAADAYGTRTSETTEYARVRFENDFTAAECERNPVRLVPFLSLNPKRGYAVEEVDRCVERAIIMPFDTLQISLAHLAGAGGFGIQQQACFERLIALCGPDTPYASRVWTDMAAVLTATTPPDDARRLGELLPRWGLHRVLWGSDNIDGAFALTRAQWPLPATAWEAIADQRGTALVPT